MGAFEYKALDTTGKTKSGVVNADSARQMRQILRDQGLTPISVNAAHKKVTSQHRTHHTKLSAPQLAIITRQFATLIESGMTVEASLNTIIAQSNEKQIKAILSGVQSQVKEGMSLVDSLRQFPRAFPEIYTASVAAGESTGKLAEVLERLAEFSEARQNIRQKIGAALVYPIILIVSAILIVIGLMTYVVPKVVKVFTDTNQELPFLTKILISISNFLLENGVIILIAIFVLFLLISLALKQKRILFGVHGLFLKIPGIQRLTQDVNTARLARILAIMIGSGVPLLTSIYAGVNVVSNLVMKDALQKAADDIQEGTSLGNSLARSGYFPPLLTQMIASGEQSGKLGHMLEKSAQALERELESKVTIMVSLFEPIMILFMGVIVLIIVVAILLPIFDLNQLVR